MNRRKILMGIGASSLLAKWHKPIVNSVLLPAHAQTSIVPVFSVETLNPVSSGANSQDIGVFTDGSNPISVVFSVNSPFTLSFTTYTFEPMRYGQSETITIDILNPDGTVNTTESVTVSWYE